jgi:N utilization substance protein B
MNRYKAREMVLCLAYEKEYHKDFGCAEMLESAFGDGGISGIYSELTNDGAELREAVKSGEYDYVKSLFEGIFANIDQLDNVIADFSMGWANSRISKISMSILRIAVYEMLFMPEIPTGVSINEAVELSKKYDTEDAYTFINGVLGAVAKSVPARDAI